ncbi:hypothetical protein M408DRAFT_331115 [Serendipita vermifera MAFF 305830]|uniref:STB6-like N-terminal domain-containing protein n=1 Tax=Serendipita vermifera MAFF 305830 TaxID=933852 RepID=A0A0C2WGP4_SERVB|nr:hypothetical protein M408DRAFT_331115 [Serendipita vermifera MAFF 305830]
MTSLSLAEAVSPASQPLTLVIPTIRAPKVSRRQDALFSKTGKHQSNRLKGHRSAHSASLDVLPPAPVVESWVSPLGKFDIEQDATELEGYQMYAVEKWVVDRSKFMKVVIVFTGNPQDVITVTVITPSATLRNDQAQEEYDGAVRELRRDGARPRQTVLGLIMITSLANFRSDLNIVKIPQGSFLDARDTLYVNINLLRLGCSGRTALTLDPPTEAIQEKFRQLYSIPVIAVQRLSFETVVLEFVRLIQSALIIFDLFDFNYERDGLLCDTVVDSVQRWTLEIGEKLEELALEPADRVLDPPVVAGILSVIASIRSKMIAILPAGANVPRDPFQYPRLFTESLALVSPEHLAFADQNGTPRAFLSAALVDYINRQYKRKTVEVKPYRLPALKPASLVNLLPTDPFSGPVAGGSKSAPETVVVETSDLIAFSKSSSVISKDPVESLHLVWTGRMGPRLAHAKHTQEIEDRRAAEERDAENKSDAKSGEDEDRFPKQGLSAGLSAIKQRSQGISARLTNLPSLQSGGRKKMSIDGASLFPPFTSSPRLSPDIWGPRRTLDHEPSPFIPEEPRSMSADEGRKRHRPFLSSIGMHSALSGNFSMSTLTTTPIEIHSQRPKTKSLDISPIRKRDERKVPILWGPTSPSLPLEMMSDEEDIRQSRVRRKKHAGVHQALKRRQSFNDAERRREKPHLTLEQLRIDMHFCATLNEVKRRRQRLKLATEAIEEFMRPLSTVRDIMKKGMDLQKARRNELNSKVDNIMPAVEDLKAIRALQLDIRRLSSAPVSREAPFKANAIAATESLKSSKYKASSDISRISELKAEVRRHREQLWQQRRLAYLPPETKKDEEDLTLSLGSKCPFLWSFQFLYKLMLLTILWAGMLRRGELNAIADDGWRRSTAFGARLDLKGRTQGDIDIFAEEEKEDSQLDWKVKTLLISAQSFASL